MKMHLEVIVVPHQGSALLQLPPSCASVFYVVVHALPPNVIVWAHVLRRRPRLTVPASCPAHMILSRRLLLPCPTLSCSSQHWPRSTSAREVDFGQPLVVSLWRFQRKIAGCTLTSAAICLRSLCKHHPAGWHAPGRHKVDETCMVLGRASNGCAHGMPDDVEVRSEVRQPRSR